MNVLHHLGVCHACISPGTRNSPLIYAFTEKLRITCFSLVDERCSAFFGLGLAKSTHRPTVLISTSGTAPANFYPAVIEASLSRVPLIILSADRPNYLVGTGSNQTIDQQNLYGNHVRYFTDVSLPINKFDFSSRFSSNRIELVDTSNSFANSRRYDFVNGFEVNVKPLSTLYLALKKCECKGIIITGSSAEYSDGNQADQETDLAFPNMPYGLSKLTETLYARQLANNYNLPTRIARVYIPFGAWDAPNKLIPSVINNLKENKSIDLSTCEQKRDFIYINDLIKAYESLLNDFNRGPIFDIFNICSGNAIRIKDLLLMIASGLNSSHDLLKFGGRQMRAGEALVSYGSNRKAIDILDWKPRNLREVISKYLQNI